MMEDRSPRRFALLRGKSPLSPAMHALCGAIQTSHRHDLIEPSGVRSETGEGDWRRFAEDDRIDVVLVCTHDEPILESARQLVMRGKPLIVEAAPTLPAEFVSEMALYDAEGTSTLKPWFPHRCELVPEARRIREAALGTWLSIQIERTTSADAAGNDLSLVRLLLIDIDWLRLLGGDYSQVTCIRTGGYDESWVTQTLQLAGPGLPDASCVYRRQLSGHGPALRVDGTDNDLETRADDDEIVTTLGGEEVDRRPHGGDKESLAELLRQQLDELWQEALDSPRWRDVVRIYEIREAMDRSLRRRRTIDLHFETTSERSQFKTQMAAIGCGVILWTLFGLIGLLFAGTVLDPRDGMQRKAEAAGFVLRAEEFVPGTDSLNDTGVRHVQWIATQMALTDAVIIIESVAERTGRQELDEGRVVNVRVTLADAGGGDDESRTVARPLAGNLFARAMLLGWVLVFGPVGLYLLLQLLLLIAKPAVRQ